MIPFNIPLHSTSAGIKFGRFDCEYVYTTNDNDCLVRLPMWYGMSDEDVEKMIGMTREFDE